jgi:hypothetical protein
MDGAIFIVFMAGSGYKWRNQRALAHPDAARRALRRGARRHAPQACAKLQGKPCAGECQMDVPDFLSAFKGNRTNRRPLSFKD